LKTEYITNTFSNNISFDSDAKIDLKNPT